MENYSDFELVLLSSNLKLAEVKSSGATRTLLEGLEVSMSLL